MDTSVVLKAGWQLADTRRKLFISLRGILKQNSLMCVMLLHKCRSSSYLTFTVNPPTLPGFQPLLSQILSSSPAANFFARETANIINADESLTI